MRSASLCLLLLTVIRSTLSMTQEYHAGQLVIKFEVFSPSGFRVSIPDEEGIQGFEFHGNVNKRMEGLSAGQFHKNVLSKTGRRWVYKNKRAVLKEGDEICFWAVVVQNDTHNIYSGELTVKDSYSDSRNHSPNTPTQTTTERSTSKKNVTLKPIPLCDLALDLSKNLEQLIEEVEKYKEINDILTDIVSRDDNLSRTLKFEGVLPAFEDTQYVVQIILQEKLNVKIPIHNVTKEHENSIKFQVNSLTDKILVIKAAKEKLEKMKSKITLKY